MHRRHRIRSQVSLVMLFVAAVSCDDSGEPRTDAGNVDSDSGADARVDGGLDSSVGPLRGSGCFPE